MAKRPIMPCLLFFMFIYNKTGDTLEKKKPKEKSQNEKARYTEKRTVGKLAKSRE